MKKLSAHKIGLVFGLSLAGYHLFWLSLVYIGVAQSLLDYIFTIHSITPIFTILPFNPTNSLALLAIAFVAGYILGYLGSMIWNKVHKI